MVEKRFVLWGLWNGLNDGFCSDSSLFTVSDLEVYSPTVYNKEIKFPV